MYLEPGAVKEILRARGVERLYHANTVVTSLSFLRNGGLLSRGHAEDIGAPQTPQQSDDQDKKLGIYYDIFFDSVDIHAKREDINHYGPVTFAYSVNVLDAPGIKVRVAKRNPISWNAEESKYFADIDALEDGYTGRDFGQHIMICDMRCPLSFAPYLEEVMIEDPKITDTSYLQQAVEALKREMEANGLTVPLTLRACPPTCNCHKTYASNQKGYTYHRFKLEI